MDTVQLFGGALRIKHQRHIWRPQDSPLPHPFGTPCLNGTLTMKIARRQADGGWSAWWQRPEGRLREPMCLAPDDFVSDYIRRMGNWRDCDSHVRLWQGLDGEYSLAPSLDRTTRWQRYDANLTLLPLASEHDPDGVAIEIGANIGACTVEMLLRTRAKIVALEPSPVNLAFLTRNLHALAQRHPDVADRVVVLPIGAGERSERVPLLVDRTNLGNSIVARQGRAATIVASSSRATSFQATPTAPSASGMAGSSALRLFAQIEPLDALFPLGLGDTRMLKIDTQGFECAVLHGAANALATAPSRLQVIATEVANKFLKAQCCKPSWLRHLLRGGGGPGLHLTLGVLHERGPQHGLWNVSCIGESAEEDLCIARPFGFGASREPLPQQLFKETPPRGESKPLRRAWIDRIRWSIDLCRRHRGEAPVIAARLAAFWRHVGFPDGHTHARYLSRTNCFVGAGATRQLGVTQVEPYRDEVSIVIECLRRCHATPGCESITLGSIVPNAWPERRRGRAWRSMPPALRMSRGCYLRGQVDAALCKADSRFDSWVGLVHKQTSVTAVVSK